MVPAIASRISTGIYLTVRAATETRTGADFSWQSAKTFWIIMIVIAVIIFLHLLYKLKNSMYRRLRPPLPGAIPLNDRERRTFQQGTTNTPWETDMQELQELPRAYIRRNSEGSVLPQYKKDGGEERLCPEDVTLEQRGRYSYVAADHRVEWRS
ncbi:hypothetical protein EJ02DRAFT_436924 [Clathrospora elynae]|uniref:Uncharacterized protein n=1 Tax=Clathrospora elynae TaxID=706981 RepID=A0A6A5SN58_9PLEO|nr:hypothetical protein EJ02DRAFT_436924 [Clathrospora elynae]